MKKFLQSLRASGKAGSFLANAIQILAYVYPALTLSVLLTVALTVLTDAVKWAQDPTVYITAAIFLFLLWTLIGVFTLRNRSTPQLVQISHDYAYSMMIDGAVQPLIGITDDTHPPSRAGAQITLISVPMRNVGSGPLRVRVEEFRVVLDGRTAIDQLEKPEMIFGRLSHKAFRSAGIPRDPAKRRFTGTMKFQIIYGPIDGDFVRKYSFLCNLNLTLNENGVNPVLVDDSLVETDEPISQQH